jgi:predicted esterase
MRLATGLALAAALAVATPPAAADGKRDEKAPGPASKGKVYTWKSADGLPYQYYVPESYDPKVGANLTFILHGTGLTYEWGFANHPAGEFRPDDVVVSPEGTTKLERGDHNFLGGDKDLKRVHALHEELRKALKVRDTYVYGHSNGAFFAFFYAGAYPEDVQGALGHAGGVWSGTAVSPKHHHQAIVLMHGTADPVVNFSNSAGCLPTYRDAKYPHARLRALEGWPHFPSAYHAGQQLAWCEGMTSADPARVVASYEHLAGLQEAVDWAALWQVANRLSGLEGAPGDARRKAGATAEAVDRLARKNVEAIERSLGKEKGDKVVDAAWVGHLPLFLRDFEGVPARDALAESWKDRLEKHQEDGVKHLREYYRIQREKAPDAAKALDAALDAIRTGFLYYECADGEFLAALEKIRADAKKAKLSKAQVKAYDGVVVPFVAGRKAGHKQYQDLVKSLD